MKLLFDNNLSPYLARGIGVVVAPYGHEVVALRDRFAEATPDIEWIEALGREGGWSVISDDHRIRKIPAERRAWRQAQIKGFFLARGWRKMPTTEKAGRLLLWWPRLVEAEELLAPSAMLEIPIRVGSRLKQLPI